jgi:hypothetical protein
VVPHGRRKAAQQGITRRFGAAGRRQHRLLVGRLRVGRHHLKGISRLRRLSTWPFITGHNPEKARSAVIDSPRMQLLNGAIASAGFWPLPTGV